MNRKGFTLIELLAVIVILGIILVIAAPNISNAYKNSKLKSEEIFIDRLSDTIDTYITLNSDDLSFSTSSSAQKSENNDVYDVKVYSSTIQINDIITSGIISEKDFVNPGNKNFCPARFRFALFQPKDCSQGMRSGADKSSAACFFPFASHSRTGALKAFFSFCV